MSRAHIDSTRIALNVWGHTEPIKHLWSYTATCDSCDLHVSGPMPDLIDIADTHARSCPADADPCPPGTIERLLKALGVTA